MHIAIATAEFITETNTGSGQAQYTANIARVLRDHGHIVSIFVPGLDNSEFPFEEGIMVYRVCYENTPKVIEKFKISKLKHYLLILWSLGGMSYIINRKIRQINKIQPIDIIHYPNSESLALFKIRHIPNIVRLSCYLPLWRHALEPDFEYIKSIDSLNLVEKLQMIAIKHADAAFGPSHCIAELTERKVKRKINVIESPFYLKNDDVDESVYNQYLSKSKYFIFYGTLNYLKGIHIIAAILDKFFTNYPDYYFVFVGRTSTMMFHGNEVDATEYICSSVSQYRDNIIYFPKMDNKEQLYALIKHAQAVVLPSRVDNLPNTCIESMALGQIVIGTDGASFEQLIEDGYNGFLIERENSSQLYEKLVQVINMSEYETELMRKRASESVNRLHPNKIYEQLIELYQSVIAAKRKRRR